MQTRLQTILIPAVIVIGIDYATKYWAWATLRGAPRQTYWNDAVRLSYHENPGAFLSLGATLPPWVRTLLFTGLVSVFLIYLFYFLLTDDTLSGRAVAYGSLMFGGGMGNLIDRIFYDGGVIDFLNVGIGSLRTGIFNVADMAILAGVIGMFIFGRPQPSPEITHSNENEEILNDPIEQPENSGD